MILDALPERMFPTPEQMNRIKEFFAVKIGDVARENISFGLLHNKTHTGFEALQITVFGTGTFRENCQSAAIFHNIYSFIKRTHVGRTAFDRETAQTFFKKNTQEWVFEEFSLADKTQFDAWWNTKTNDGWVQTGYMVGTEHKRTVPLFHEQD